MSNEDIDSHLNGQSLKQFIIDQGIDAASQLQFLKPVLRTDDEKKEIAARLSHLLSYAFLKLRWPKLNKNLKLDDLLLEEKRQIIHIVINGHNRSGNELKELNRQAKQKKITPSLFDDY